MYVRRPDLAMTILNDSLTNLADYHWYPGALPPAQNLAWPFCSYAISTTQGVHQVGPLRPAAEGHLVAEAECDLFHWSCGHETLCLFPLRRHAILAMDR